MNKLFFGTAFAALALAAPIAASAQQLPAAVIAVIDRDRIAGTCTQCVAASQQLQAQITQLQQREQQLTAPLQTEGQAIQTAINALPQGTQPDAALQARARTWETSRTAATSPTRPADEDGEATRLPGQSPSSTSGTSGTSGTSRTPTAPPWGVPCRSPERLSVTCVKPSVSIVPASVRWLVSERTAGETTAFLVSNRVCGIGSLTTTRPLTC